MPCRLDMVVARLLAAVLVVMAVATLITTKVTALPTSMTRSRARTAARDQTLSDGIAPSKSIDYEAIFSSVNDGDDDALFGLDGDDDLQFDEALFAAGDGEGNRGGQDFRNGDARNNVDARDANSVGALAPPPEAASPHFTHDIDIDNDHHHREAATPNLEVALVDSPWWSAPGLVQRRQQQENRQRLELLQELQRLLSTQTELLRIFRPQEEEEQQQHQRTSPLLFDDAASPPGNDRRVSRRRESATPPLKRRRYANMETSRSPTPHSAMPMLAPTSAAEAEAFRFLAHVAHIKDRGMLRQPHVKEEVGQHIAVGLAKVTAVEDIPKLVQVTRVPVPDASSTDFANVLIIKDPPRSVQRVSFTSTSLGDAPEDGDYMVDDLEARKRRRNRLAKLLDEQLKLYAKGTG